MRGVLVALAAALRAHRERAAGDEQHPLGRAGVGASVRRSHDLHLRVGLGIGSRSVGLHLGIGSCSVGLDLRGDR